MTTKLKEDLIQLLQTLKQVPKQEEPRIERLISRLAKKDIVIPATNKAKEQLGGFIDLLLDEIPTLNSSSNEKIFEKFFKKNSPAKAAQGEREKSSHSKKKF